MYAGTVAKPGLIEVDAPAACLAAREATASHASGPGITLAAAVLGFFVITLDAVVVNVALPSISRDFGAGITGLQWVVDGYTLMFAALLLWSGALADRVGARRAFGVGLGLFVAASAACGLAPTLPALIAARFARCSPWAR
jgi:MFS transporter, DHA2 family, methylenomycin A resistance protein